MTYASTVRNHFVTSLGTSETAAENREKFLRELHDYQLSALDEGGRGDMQAYILPTQADRAQVIFMNAIFHGSAHTRPVR
jgi:hypothetical protein